VAELVAAARLAEVAGTVFVEQVSILVDSFVIILATFSACLHSVEILQHLALHILVIPHKCVYSLMALVVDCTAAVLVHCDIINVRGDGCKHSADAAHRTNTTLYACLYHISRCVHALRQT
jgi:hypothetical protein